MAGKRIYITIPVRDWELMRRIGTSTTQCPGQLAREWVLRTLYERLKSDHELWEYDQALARQDLEEVLRGRSS